MFLSRIVFFLSLTIISTGLLFSQDSHNTIGKHDFNFGHQSGYMYSRTDSAYFREAGAWSFETGFLGYYTEKMPRVLNPKWQERLMLLIPLGFEYYPCNRIAVQFVITDLFVEFPYRNIHSMGGKSPRFATKMLLAREGKRTPATAFTVGVTFSSAKPYNIWEHHHNYEESNGLAGAGTGVTDYLLLFTFSKRLNHLLTAHGRLGLAPLGSPVEYQRGSSQADEIPYGLLICWSPLTPWTIKGEISGMYNGLSSTKLAHYSVLRFAPEYHFKKCGITLNLEKGLTQESDDWVAGIYTKIYWGTPHP